MQDYYLVVQDIGVREGHRSQFAELFVDLWGPSSQWNPTHSRLSKIQLFIVKLLKFDQFYRENIQNEPYRRNLPIPKKEKDDPFFLYITK